MTTQTDTVVRYKMIKRDPAAAQKRVEDLEAAQLAEAPKVAALRDAAGAAFERLLVLAETRDSGQIAKVMAFLAALYNWNAYRFDLTDLRCLDDSIADDMLAVLSAQKGFAPYAYDMPGVNDGERRLAQLVTLWKPVRWVRAE